MNINQSHKLNKNKKLRKVNEDLTNSNTSNHVSSNTFELSNISMNNTFVSNKNITKTKSKSKSLLKKKSNNKIYNIPNDKKTNLVLDHICTDNENLDNTIENTISIDSTIGVNNTDNHDISNISSISINEIMSVPKNRDILVLSGGSSKGVAQLGALHCLKKYNMLSKVNTIAGTSVGSMVGLFYIIGYQPLELYKFISLVDLEMVKKINAHNVITKYGLDDGSRMMLVVKKLMSAKEYDPDITFLELYTKTCITFFVTGACINDKKAYYFSHNDNPNMKVIDAIRISISLPIVFTPCIYEGKIFVDGGCIDNFPIHLFRNDMDRVVGIYVSECRKVVNDIKYIEDYLINIIECLLEGITYRDTNNSHKCVIVIRCSKSGETSDDIANMFDEGYLATEAKIKASDFD
jgi:predicted acylesterase/phospholipase RssA